MKRKFEIRDEKRDDSFMGYLYYDTDTDKYSMTLPESYKDTLGDVLPEIFFDECNKQGITEVPDYLVDMWIRGRVIPPNRQGIKGILAEMGMTEYNVFDMLIYCDGRCFKDKLYLKEVTD